MFLYLSSQSLITFFLSVMTAILILFLGIFVFSNDRKKNVNKVFLLMDISIVLWILSVGLRFNTDNPILILAGARLSYAMAAIVAFLINYFCYYFTQKNNYRFPLFLGVFLTAIVVLLSYPGSYIIRDINLTNGVQENIFGPLFFVFALFFPFNVGWGVYNLLTKKSFLDQMGKVGVNFILTGVVFSTTIGFSTNLIIPSLFGTSITERYGPLSPLFFIVLTTYAILKHHLFDVRVIATELLTFALWLTLLVKTFLSVNVQDFAFNSIILAFAVFFGILLIKSVLREVRQREKMERMAGDLEVAYGVEKQAKERVEKAKAEDEALLGSIGDGVVAVDKGGEVMFVNRAAEEMLGFKSEQVIAKPYKQVLEMQNEKNEALENGKDPIYEALNSGKKIITDATNTPEKTVYFIRGDKTKFPAAITVAPVILQGKTIGAVNVFRDVTVERQIDKSKSEFVSLASHQLRTPLTAVKWYVEMTMNAKTGKLNPKQKQYLDVIYKGNMRMIDLVDLMLNVSRLDAGKVKIRYELADIRKVAEIIIQEEQVNIKKRKHNFIFECEEKEAKTVTDPHQLRIVFQNVISNAIKYTQEKGKIVCSIKKEGDNYVLSIKDNGIGIPKEQQKRVFEKLFRADNAFSHEPDGSGLGLYAAKATIGSLGGRIWFESQEGKGTTFFISVPIRTESPSKSAPDREV